MLHLDLQRVQSFSGNCSGHGINFSRADQTSDHLQALITHPYKCTGPPVLPDNAGPLKLKVEPYACLHAIGFSRLHQCKLQC